MNNSFDRLIDGMTATLRKEVLTRLDDDFARGQVFGVINLLNTFKARADWSAGFLKEQIAAQEEALAKALSAMEAVAAPSGASPPAARSTSETGTTGDDVESLLARRDANNGAIDACLAWLDAVRDALPAHAAATIEAPLRRALRAEVDLELRHSPRPLFSEMSSGRED